MALSSVIVTAAPAKSKLPKLAVVVSPKVTVWPVETMVANPGTETTPLSDKVPPVVTVRFCPTPTVPRSKAFTSVIETSAPVLLKLTAPVKSFAASRVIALAPAAILEVPSASMAPVWVIAPLAVRLNAPVASDAARDIALASVIATVEPAKSMLPKLAVVPSPRVMALPPDPTVAKPPTVMFALSVIAPVEETVSASPTDTAPRSMALTSLRETSLPVSEAVTLTAPVKSLFALSKVMAASVPPVLSKSEVLSASIRPVCEMAPLAVRLRAPVASDSAIDISLASVIATVEPAKSMLPKLAVVPLAVVPSAAKPSPRVIALPPETKVAKPATVKLPESVIVPFEVTFSSPPVAAVFRTLTVPKSIAFTSFTSTRFATAPLVFSKLTAPAKSLSSSSLIALAPASNLDVEIASITPV